MTSRHVVGLEALARWDDPTEGVGAPDYCIPAAERTGTISDLDRYVLRKAMRHVSGWSSNAQPLGVSVTVSATRFAEPDPAQDISAALSGTRLAPEHLHLRSRKEALIQDVGASAAQSLYCLRWGKRRDRRLRCWQTSLSYLNSP